MLRYSSVPGDKTVAIFRENVFGGGIRKYIKPIHYNGFVRTQNHYVHKIYKQRYHPEDGNGNICRNLEEL
jgi:hypothetical protein